MKTMTQREQLTYMKKFLDYLEIYGDNYPDEAIGLLEPEKNCYLGFAKMIGETYGWNSHILEVGGIQHFPNIWINFNNLIMVVGLLQHLTLD